MFDQKLARLEGSHFNLRREGDGKGERGSQLRSIDMITLQSSYGEIKTGYVVRCGTNDYWWTTSVVKEILEVSEDGKRVKFTTKNSTYVVTAE